MTEGQYQALHGEVVDRLAELDCHRGELSYSDMADCAVAFVQRELAARDAEIQALTDAGVEKLARHYAGQRVLDAVRDLCWKATRYGETEDGDTAAYILPKGAVHRLVGAMQCDGHACSLRASDAPLTSYDGEVEQTVPLAAEVQRLTTELAARDAVIEQIRALAEEWRAAGVGNPGDSPLDADLRILYELHGNEIQRLLSSLPSTGETGDE